MNLLRALFEGFKLGFGLVKQGISKLLESPLTLWSAFASLTSLSGSFFVVKGAELIFNKILPRAVFASGSQSVSDLIEMNPIAGWVCDMAALDVLGRWILQLLAFWAVYRVALLGKAAIIAVLHIIP